MGRNMVTHSNWGLANAVDMILYISLYFLLNVLLIQQIGSIRAVIKGRELGILPRYYKHDPQLFS